jgi:hypothetical protein
VSAGGGGGKMGASPRVATSAFCRRCLGAGSGFPLQSFAVRQARRQAYLPTAKVFPLNPLRDCELRSRRKG